MDNNTFSFKAPPKKHQPRGLTIVYEDKEIIVVDKINGLLTVSTDREKEKTAHFLLNDYVKKGNTRSRNRVYIVHRLDRETSGLLLFAKSEQSKRYLQDNWQDFSKTYLTVVHGRPKDKVGVITTYLAENKAYRMYSVPDSTKGKLAKTGYKVLKTAKGLSLLEIELFTGRKNQIRVHLAENGHPVVGDKMYGKIGKGGMTLALHATTLTITHPITKKEMFFEAAMPIHLKTLVRL
jgi:tRNA pseudouridine32 synthase/23S rRNA pseudouridine746 synthase/23S rRNA pseudouridine1911/1915/1917 synthase